MQFLSATHLAWVFEVVCGLLEDYFSVGRVIRSYVVWDDRVGACI